MKKLKALSKAELKEIGGGLRPGSTCPEGSYYARCSFPIDVVSYDPMGPGLTGGPVHDTYYFRTEGCMTMADYTRDQQYCVIIDAGGPYAL